LLRKDVAIRSALGVATPQETRHELAEIDIAYAFEHYQRGLYAAVPRLVLSGLNNNAAYMGNRGVWSILVRSAVRTGLSYVTGGQRGANRTIT
jgi:hypothetical protein